MKVYGLTGGIATGKSTVEQALRGPSHLWVGVRRALREQQRGIFQDARPGFEHTEGPVDDRIG